LHPDKFKPVTPSSAPGDSPRKLSKHAIKLQRKAAEERYSRLRLVYDILKGPDRVRYDHFLKNGFPRWRGTGYYYARFRPGLGTVVLGLFIFVGGWGHYAYLWLSVRQQKGFIKKFIREARVSAWGSTGVPGLTDVAGAQPTSPAAPIAPEGNEGPRNRKERRSAKKAGRGGDEGNGGGSNTPAPQLIGSAGMGRRKVVAGNGKVLIVNSTGDVFLVEENEDGEEVELKLDADEIQSPRFTDTAMCKLPVWIFRRMIGRFLGRDVAKGDANGEGVEEGEAEEAVAPGQEGEEKTVRKAVMKPAAPVKVEKRDGLPRRKVSRK